jgi:hypothetical protein
MYRANRPPFANFRDDRSLARREVSGNPLKEVVVEPEVVEIA